MRIKFGVKGFTINALEEDDHFLQVCDNDTVDKGWLRLDVRRVEDLLGELIQRTDELKAQASFGFFANRFEERI